MPEDREEVQRRRDRDEMEARGRVGAMFIMFFFLVAIPAWVFVGWYFLGLFRTTPLKGTKHPNKTVNSTNGTDTTQVTVAPRWWVYQHPPTNTSRIGPEEEAYRKKREEMDREFARAQKKYITNFEIWYGVAHGKSPELIGGSFFTEFLNGVFEARMPAGRRYKTSQMNVPPSTAILIKTRDMIDVCVADPTACGSRILGHLHYGDNPDIYYDSRNAFFVFKGDDFVRVFVIDIIRLPAGFGDTPVDPSPLIALIESEHPSTDEAWCVDPEYPESEDAMSVDTATFKESKMIYEEPYNAILNFLHAATDGILGLRFTEVVGKLDHTINDQGARRVKILHSDASSVMVKERKTKVKLPASSPGHSVDPNLSAERTGKDEF
jgi:hypothetical protein